jgi:hypothetical protein
MRTQHRNLELNFDVPKATITLTMDGDDAVKFKFDFNPPVDMQSDEPMPLTHIAAAQMMDLYTQYLKGNTNDTEPDNSQAS